VGLEVAAELPGDQVPQHVFVVVDGGDRYVYLRRPVGLVPPGRTLDELEALDEIPLQ
jgi:hypothetical protein